ncbi:uncharacterized protein BP5553_02816 [Venustampulla echinocandica]|uniref:Ubiquitin-conjugating enzyme E2-binding protein n=1 Tax=Venustampulla echinocandica TaxID=2656787 RepID=A0A370TSH3_9HELO|nr:uncharacterized protein BP5553_02816 [Venustampulla echinocandica]RDL38476.1 hypothetical protein BP5553_02816 [Venustampulla echinocandica]
MSRCKTLVYAELLANIRQISIVAALDTPCNSTTKAELSPNGLQVTLYHEGEVIATNLPGQVAAKGALQKPALGSRELSWRLPLAGALPAQYAEKMQSSDVAWSAKQLGQDSEFLCRECGTVIIRNGSIKTWKDLPSENWAEMMEFWHCHKPDDHNHESNGASGHEKHIDAEKSLADRGYGANTKFMPRSGFALVGLTTFHITASDCTGLQLFNRRNIRIRKDTVQVLQQLSWARRSPNRGSQTSQMDPAAVIIHAAITQITVCAFIYFLATGRYFAIAVCLPYFAFLVRVETIDNLSYYDHLLVGRVPSVIGAIQVWFVSRANPPPSFEEQLAVLLVAALFNLAACWLYFDVPIFMDIGQWIEIFVVEIFGW